ncbi:hypothetical protein ACFLS1_06770 [Verrucomicrobiota bacterium]
MKRFRSLLIMAVSLLTLNAIEEVIIFKLKRTVINDYLFTLILLAMFGSGFIIVADILVPWIRNTIKGVHKTSKRNAGYIGVTLLYAGFFILFFMVYHVIYNQGPQHILPRSWR